MLSNSTQVALIGIATVVFRYSGKYPGKDFFDARLLKQ